MKKNPQAPLKLNLNPRPSTKPYRKGRGRERDGGNHHPREGGNLVGLAHLVRPLRFRIPFPMIPSR